MSTITTEQAARILAAEAGLEVALGNVMVAEDALEEAKRALTRAEGRLLLAKNAPTWKKILCPGIQTDLRQLYTNCMQLGYSYALFNGRIYVAGPPAKGMIDTGLTEEDIT
jgi:hypothetical protein